MRARISGAWKEVPAATVRVDNAWKTARRIEAYIAGAWEEVASFIPSLSLTADSVFGDDTGTTVISTASAAVPSGGLAPYTYAWTMLTGTATALSPTTALCRFSESGLAAEEMRTSTARCTVTDASGQTATADITIIITRVSFS